MKDMIDSEEFLKKHRIGSAFTRKRKLSFANMMYFLLNNDKKSLAINASSFRNNFSKQKFPDISKQAISKARQGISYQAFNEFFKLSVRLFYKDYQKINTLNGYNVLAIDGTTIQVPSTDENIDVFGYNPNHYSKLEALTSGSLLYDALNDYIIDAKLYKYRYDERKSTLEHLKTLKDLSFPSNTIITFDRGYPSYGMFDAISRANLYFVMRVPKFFKQITGCKKQDVIIDYKHPKSNESIILRAIRVDLPNGKVEYLATNLLDQNFTVDTFKKIYFLRWGIECKYKVLKKQLQLENFSGTKPIAIKQDFYIAILISNLVSLIKLSSDSLVVNNDSNSVNKYKYQSNRGFIINKVKKLLVKMIISFHYSSKIIKNIITEASRIKSIIRPMRSFERRVRMTSRKYYINSKICI